MTEQPKIIAVVTIMHDSETLDKVLQSSPCESKAEAMNQVARQVVNVGLKSINMKNLHLFFISTEPGGRPSIANKSEGIYFTKELLKQAGLAADSYKGIENEEVAILDRDEHGNCIAVPRL